MDSNPCEPEQLREYLVGLLKNKHEFSGAKILSRKVANLQREIETSLARDGLLILVLIPELTPTAWQSGTVKFDPVEVRIRVTENVLINSARGGATAMQTACRVMAWMMNHKTPFPWCGVIQPTAMRELNIIPSSPEEDEDDDYAAWDCIFKTQIIIMPRPTTN
jgi:hypothetical protein